MKWHFYDVDGIKGKKEQRIIFVLRDLDKMKEGQEGQQRLVSVVKFPPVIFSVTAIKESSWRKETQFNFMTK